MEKISVSPKLYFYVEAKTTLNHVKECGEKQVQEVFEEAAKAGLEKTGPLEFIYFNASMDREREVTLQVALPVKEAKHTDQHFHYRKATNFPCLSYRHQGSIQQMDEVYDELFEHIWNQSIKVNNEIREVYHAWEGPESNNNLTEIQIGLGN